jgi:hypothetical protein
MNHWIVAYNSPVFILIEVEMFQGCFQFAISFYRANIFVVLSSSFVAAALVPKTLRHMMGISSAR